MLALLRSFLVVGQNTKYYLLLIDGPMGDTFN